MHDPDLARQGRRELLAGINLGVAGTAGFVAGLSLYGQHSGMPRLCLASQQAQCERDAERHERIALAGQIIALSSIALMMAGAALTAVGATHRHRSRAVALRPGGLSLRF